MQGVDATQGLYIESAPWMTEDAGVNQNVQGDDGMLVGRISEDPENDNEQLQKQTSQWGSPVFGHVLSNEEAQYQMTLSQEKTYTQIMQEMVQSNDNVGVVESQGVGSFTRLLNTAYGDLDFDDDPCLEYVDDHSYYMTTDRSININQMECDELEDMYNMQNEIGLPDTLAETHVEEQDDWIQENDAEEMWIQFQTMLKQPNIQKKKVQMRKLRKNTMKKPQVMSPNVKT